MTRTQVFVSYSHKDEAWKHKIYTQLDVLQQNDRLKLWCDRDIQVGEQWHNKIDCELSSAKVAVLIISPDFLTSEFITRHEIPKLLQKHQQEGMKLVPVLLRDCVWEAVDWLKNLQMVPRDAKPVVGFPEAMIDTVLADIARQVLKYVAIEGGRRFQVVDNASDRDNSARHEIGPWRLWKFVSIVAIGTMSGFFYVFLSSSEWGERIKEGHRIVEPGIIGFALLYVLLIWADILLVAMPVNFQARRSTILQALGITAAIFGFYLMGFLTIYLSHP